jgi:hypothetical protein
MGVVPFQQVQKKAMPTADIENAPVPSTALDQPLPGYDPMPNGDK